MANRVPQSSTALSKEVSAEVAFLRFAAERRSLSRRELLPVNLDIPTVVARVFGTIARLRRLYPRLPTDRVRLTLDELERLDGLVQALLHAHGRRKTAHEPDDQLSALYEEGRNLRATLWADVQPLIRRGLLPKPGPRARTRRTGYKNVASDLLALAAFLDKHTASLAGHTSLQPADLRRARHLAERLLRTSGQRAHAPKVVAAAADEQQRAFTLVLRAYDELRRTVSYLRWHEGDAERLAPSLWKGRGRRERKGTPAP